MNTIRQTLLLSGRSLRESLRAPESVIPTLAIPLFFLVVNVGQAGKIFSATAPFLKGHGYAAFQLPNSLLLAEAAKNVVVTAILIVAAIPLGISVASGPVGLMLLLALAALWAVTYAGFMQMIALTSRSSAATHMGGLVFFPLLFLTPNFVPRDLLTRPMEIAATFNPVTYVMEAMRSLILGGLDWTVLARGAAVLAVLCVVMVSLNVRLINRYD